MLSVNVSPDALIEEGDPAAADWDVAPVRLTVSVAPVPDSVRVSPRLLRLIVSPLPLTVSAPEFKLNVALLAETVVPVPLKLTWLPAATLTVAPLPNTVSLLPLIVRLFPETTLTLSPLPVSDIEVAAPANVTVALRSEEHTSELQSRVEVVCRLLLEKRENVLLLPLSVTCALSG